MLIVAYWFEVSAAGQPLLRADRLLGLAEPVPRLPLSGGAPAAARCGVRHLDVRRPAARRPALSDRRPDQSVLAADDRAGGHLGDVAAAAADRPCSARWSIAMATLLVFFHLPLPWFPGTELPMPVRLCRRACGWRWSPASPSPASMPGASPRRRGCWPTRSTATELVLQREQHLSALDGLAAAAAHELGTPLATIALVAKEMERALGGRPALRARTSRCCARQSERCREILKRLTSLSSEGEAHLCAPAADLAGRGGDRAASRFRHRDQARAGRADRPRAGRAAQSGRHLRARQSGRERRRFRPQDASPCAGAGTTQVVGFTIIDDGPGFPPEIIDRIGEPYMSTRQGTEPGGGLGLGLFIAKTLLERSGRHARVPQFDGAGRGRHGRDRLAARGLPHAAASRLPTAWSASTA